MSEAAISIANLVLYCAQQLGVTLGVGAETVLLVAYIHSIRDGIVDEKEKGFSRAVRKVMDVALVLIIASGLGVIATQYLSGQSSLFSVTFLFKWSLIGIVLAMSLANRGSSLTAGLLQGLSAGTWYALFAVHILAPEAGWLSFFGFYGAWLVGFMVVWTSIVFSFKGKTIGSVKPAQKQNLPQRVPLSGTTVPSGAVAPAYVSGKSVSASAVIVTPDKAAPSVSRMPEQNFAAVRQNRSESFVQAPSKAQPIPVPIPQAPKPPAVQSMPVPVPPPPPPKPAVVSVPVSPAMPPPPPPPPPPAKQPPSPGAPLGVLHVMPRTLEEVQQRKQTPA